MISIAYSLPILLVYVKEPMDLNPTVLCSSVYFLIIVIPFICNCLKRMLNVLAYYVLFVLSFFTCAKAEKIRKNIERLLERMEKAKEKTNYEHKN